MGKFRVGEQVRSTASYLRHFGQVATVLSVKSNSYQLRFGDGVVVVYFEQDLEPAEPLKLEVGATVTIGDGKDEWKVTRVLPGLCPDQAEINRPGVSFWAHPRNLTVVKAKPEPPKPDYYVNCKGAEPKDGDVFLAAGKVAGIADGFYQFLWGSRPHSLTDPIKAHSIGKEYYPRTLLARDNQPYTGNV